MYGIDLERKVSATVFVLCDVHRWRAKPLAEVHLGHRRLEVKREGSPFNPFRLHDSFSAQCLAINQDGRCRIRVSLRYAALVKMTDGLRERNGRAIEFSTREINALINQPIDLVRRYTLERAKMIS